MLNCESCELLIADSLYENLDRQQETQLQAHLQTCATCKALLQELSAAKRSLHEQGIDGQAHDDIPERANLDAIWDRIQPELDRADAERFRELNKRRYLPLVASAMAIAASVAVFFSVLVVDEEPITPTPVVASAPLISTDLMNYLTRAESMLLMVANAESEDTSAIPVTSNFARDMAFEANYLTSSMGDSFNSGQARLLRDIEFMLLQIANLDEANMADGVALLQQYLEDNSVLFKIRLLEMRNQQAVI